MRKNAVIAGSWCVTVALLIGLAWLWGQFAHQNSALRNLRADLWRQQVSMRDKQVQIAQRLDGVDEGTRREILDLLLESATEVDELREQNGLWHGQDDLARLKQVLEEARPGPSSAAVGKQVAPEE